MIPVAHPRDTQAPLPDNTLFGFPLPACGSLLLVATTNLITQDVAPVPFLWILPLALYLLSFVISFGGEKWYDRRFWSPAMFISMAAVGGVILPGLANSIFFQITVYSASLFVFCMVCHGELARLKPDPQFLTYFYLCIAAGGVMGGFFVALAAPWLFSGYWEYPVGLIVMYGLFTICLFRDSDVFANGPLRRIPIFLLAGLLFLLAGLGFHIQKWEKGAIATVRNFHGVLRVHEYGLGTEKWHRLLRHGRLEHGIQFLAPSRRQMPASYIGYTSGIAIAMEHGAIRNPEGLTRKTSGKIGLNIGVVGMGVGTISVFGKAGDSIRYYEINPEVLRLSREYFTYRKDSPIEETVILGDARVSMERELTKGHTQGFDILVLDAFNSDAVPIHLLTREAFEIYWAHLKPNGILAVHISAIHLDLGPVIRGLAKEFSKQAIRIVNKKNSQLGTSWSDWMLVTSNKEFINDGIVRELMQSESGQPRVWTDDFSNLLHVVR